MFYSTQVSFVDLAVASLFQFINTHSVKLIFSFANFTFNVIFGSFSSFFKLFLAFDSGKMHF